MPKKKISKKRDFSFDDMPSLKAKNKSELTSFGASKRIKNKKYISQALWECLVANDTEAFKEILRAHLELINKDEFAEAAGISRRTLFRILSADGNPTLANISKIIHKLCA